ncbi:MAG: YdcF family protein [Betaproteobacteria bacterium]|nr:YdcF family protein [Betaproteobacteria bacterium]
MMDWVVVRKILANLVLPPTGPLLLTMIGLLLLRRRPRIGKTLAWAGMAGLLALSLPVVAAWLAQTVGGAKALDLQQPVAAQAIVVLGGGTRHNAADYGGDTVSRLSLERARYGAFLAKRYGLPLLTTGGVVSKGAPEAELMRNTLQQEFATAVRWAETQSRNTRENARNSARMLKADGISHVLLVTHFFDVRRARLEFEAAGLQVTPAPTGGGQLHKEPMALGDFLPSTRALETSYYACYEALALVLRRWL